MGIGSSVGKTASENISSAARDASKTGKSISDDWVSQTRDTTEKITKGLEGLSVGLISQTRDTTEKITNGLKGLSVGLKKLAVAIVIVTVIYVGWSEYGSDKNYDVRAKGNSISKPT